MLSVLVAMSLATVARAEPPHAFAEAATPRTACYRGQRIPITLRVGFDRAFFETSVVRTLRREMDVYLHVNAPWFDGDDALRLVAREVDAAPDDGRPWSTFALNDDVVAGIRVADRVVDGRIFTVLEVSRTFVATRATWCEAPGPVVEYAWATRFEETGLGDRVPHDRRDVSVAGEDAPFQILAIPTADRPDGWTGAVGRFSVHAEVAPRELKAGETLRLTLRIEGEGELDAFDAPRLASLPGFHVLGRLDQTANGIRTIGYDLEPRDASVAEIPAIDLPYFDPSPPAGFRISRTVPIPIVVPGDVHVATADAGDDVPADGTHARSWPWIAGIALVLAVAIGAIVARRGRRTEIDPEEQAARDAADAIRARLGGPSGEVADAFADYLATRLGIARAAVISPDLASRLERAGVPVELAASAARRCERLVATRYGAGDAAPDADGLGALVDELEAVFRTTPR